MSKKIVVELTEDELELLDALLWMGIDEVPYDDAKDGAKLTVNIKEQAKKSRSIIEWHDIKDKRPQNGRQILVILHRGEFALSVGGSGIDAAMIKCWAYLS